jgi:GH25 family lysozyme M1 (1,4-beta-N-acetylmuramidase)
MASRLCLDTSNNNPIGQAALRNSGASLLICKATEGTGFKDDTLWAHRLRAKRAKVRFGSYLFLHARQSGAAQAEFYLGYAKPRPGELVVIDAEPGGQDGETVGRMAGVADACARQLEHAGHHPILYASSSYWLQLIRAEPTLRRLKVWEAQYPGRFSRWLPRLARLRVRLRHGVTVVLWQFTDSYRVSGRGYDASRILSKGL